MAFLNNIPNEELERAASEWALAQVKEYANPVKAAEKFYKLRVEFIETYRVEEGKGQ